MVRYTHRQRRAVEVIRVRARADATRIAAAGGSARHRRATPTDDRYADAVAGPIREAQALVAGSDTRHHRPPARLPAPVPPAGRHRHGRPRPGHPAQPGAGLPGRLPHRPGGAPGAGGTARCRERGRPRSRSSAWRRSPPRTCCARCSPGSGCGFMAFLGEYVARDLRTEIYEHLQTLSLSFFSRKKTGSLITRVTSDTDRLWEFLAFGIVDVSLSAVMLVGHRRGAHQPRLAARAGDDRCRCRCCAASSSSTASGSSASSCAPGGSGRASPTCVSDTIPGIRVVKAFNQEDSERRRFDLRNAGGDRPVQPRSTRCGPASGRR